MAETRPRVCPACHRTLQTIRGVLQGFGKPPGERGAMLYCLKCDRSFPAPTQQDE